MKYIYIIIAFTLASLSVFGSKITTLVDTSEQHLTILSDFTKAISNGSLADLAPFVRIPPNLNLNDEGTSLLLSEFMKVRKDEFAKLDGKEGVIVSLISTGDNFFSVSFKVEISDKGEISEVSNTLNKPESPKIEVRAGISSNGQVKYRESYSLLMNFKRDADGWYFHSGSASSAK